MNAALNILKKDMSLLGSEYNNGATSCHLTVRPVRSCGQTPLRLTEPGNAAQERGSAQVEQLA